MQLEVHPECSAGLSQAMCKTSRHISVKVENVFEEGMVVSYVGPNGEEYRGAMLTQAATGASPQPAVLANPLTFVHDHPYTEVKQYAKHVSTKIPPGIMLNWNTPPGNSDIQNLKTIETRRKKSNLSLQNGLIGRPDHTVSRSATVVTEPVKDPCSFSNPKSKYVAIGGRSAKKEANFKIFNNRGNLYPDQRDPLLTSRRGRSRVKKTVTVTTHAKRPVPSTKKASLASSAKRGRESSADSKLAPSPKKDYPIPDLQASSKSDPQSSLPLKTFTIPVVRVKPSDCHEFSATSITSSPLSSPVPSHTIMSTRCSTSDTDLW